jgi:hypothetical protein
MNASARWLALVPGVLLLAACGFTGNLRMDPGFASFGTPSTLGGADRQFGLSLGPVPLRLATLISRPIFADETWIPETIKSVRGVRVYSYDVGGDDGRVRDHLEATRNELIAAGWQSVIAVREDGGLVAALVMLGDPKVIRGLVVMYEEDADLVLVNVIGNLTPETLGTLMAGLDIELPVMEISGG